MLQVKKKQWVKRQTLFVQCSKCLDITTVDALVEGKKILKFDLTSHMVGGQGRRVRCWCGGYLRFFG